MKKIKYITIFACLTLLFASCATTRPTNGIGIGAVTMVTEPMAVGPSTSKGELKKGEATALNVLGIVVIGDYSINAAAENGKIKVIKSVDKKVINILGIFGQVTTIVYGE